MLKAIGYTNREIAMHYAGLVGVFTLAGAAFGVGLGALLGRGMLELYRPFFRFPDLAFRLDPGIVVTGVVISLVTGFAGALTSVMRAVRVPPAEAMRPESPAVYRRPLLEMLGLHRLVGVAGRMVLREIMRRPLRATLSCIGIGFATAVTVSGYFMQDSMDLLIGMVFERAQREDVEVSFLRPVSGSVVREAALLPGVLAVEPRRLVPVRIHADQRERDVVIVASPDRLVPLRVPPLWPPTAFQPPSSGIAVSRKLGELLQVGPGDRVVLELLEGDRRKLDVPIVALVDDVFGIQAYATDDSVHRLLDEERTVTSILLRVERGKEDALVQRLASMRNVAGISRRAETLAQFLRQTNYMGVMTFVLTMFGAVIAFGVVYNQARIALSMRSRDLASLRVLGFTRSEISAVLLGELGVYVAIGIPLGFVFGRWLVDLIMATVDPEGYRMPGIVTARTYAFAALATLGAALASALVVRRKLDRLDLVGVLKTRE
jgi:putative ABC transport system permease protein